MHTGRRRNRRIIVSSGTGVLQRLMQVASTFVLMPLLLRVLGPAQFGVWGAAASLAWLAGLMDIGTGAALVTLVARSTAQGDSAAARRYIAGALSFGCWLAGLIGLAALLVTISGAPLARTGTYLIAVLGLAVNIPLSAANNVWMALQKGYLSSFWELVQVVLTFAGLVVAASSTTSVQVCVAVVFAGLVLSNMGSLLHLFWRHPELRPDGLLMPLEAIRTVAGQGLMYFFLSLAGGLSFLLDNVLALALLGAEPSARMTIASRICVMALGTLGVASQPLWPAFAEAAESNDRHWIRRVLFRGSALLLGTTIAGSAILVVFGQRLLRWWLHGTLEIDQTLLWAIAAWVLAQELVRVPCLLLNGLSIVRYQIWVSAAATALAFAWKILLSSHLGVAGILWGTTASVLLVVFPAVTWRVAHWARRHPPGKGISASAVIVS
ncbi:MAG: oligosaccharide flippase family protein [Bryobacteraceae bacterium]|jgi:O-antigen/teichoic acid export membrane protein